jgi:single-stranded-DNA-specific exonuclease
VDVLLARAIIRTTLPGCGNKLIEALFTQTGRAERAGKFLDLVALGIVADVAYQIGDARYLRGSGKYGGQT